MRHCRQLHFSEARKQLVAHWGKRGYVLKTTLKWGYIGLETAVGCNSYVACKHIAVEMEIIASIGVIIEYRVLRTFGTGIIDSFFAMQP